MTQFVQKCKEKFFPLGEGWWGEEGSEKGSEEKSCENFLSILTFSREKSVLTKVVPYDAIIIALFFHFDTFPNEAIKQVERMSS